jgi:hypothetical protein
MYVMLSGMFAMYKHPLFILLTTYSLLAIVLKPCDICDNFYNLSILE